MTETTKKRRFRGLKAVLGVIVGLWVLLIIALQIVLDSSFLTNTANKYAAEFIDGNLRFGNISASVFKSFPNLNLTVEDATITYPHEKFAAYDTIGRHLSDRGMKEMDFDWIVTGDLGDFGSRMLRELADEGGMDLEDRHMDCGSMIFSPQQGYHCGGSGCGCSAVLLAGYVLPQIERGAVKRVLFLSTGALMSPLSACQGESIPGIAHGISLVYEE